MSAITTSNGYHQQQQSSSSNSTSSNVYWRSSTSNINGTGSLSSGNHSPLSSNSSSSSLSGPATATVHVKNYNSNSSSTGNGYLLSSSNNNSSRYQSPYFEPKQQQQLQQQPSPKPRSITTSNISSNNYNGNNKYINNTNSMSLSRGLFSASGYDEQQQQKQQQSSGIGMRGGICNNKPQYNSSFSNGNGNGIARRNNNSSSSNEINVTVNSSSSTSSNNSNDINSTSGSGRNKYYTNGIISTTSSSGGNGNYYIPGIEKDKIPSTNTTSSGGVSVHVGRSSSYSQLNTIGRINNNGYNSSNNSSNNNYYFNNGTNNVIVPNLTQNHSTTADYQQQRYNNSSNSNNSQTRRMNNGVTNSSNGNVSSTITNATNSSLNGNGTVAVAVVTRSQNKQHQHETVETTSNNYYNGVNSTNTNRSSSNKYLGNSGSESRNNSRQINIVGSVEQQQQQANCNNNNLNHHRPAQRINSYPTGTKIHANTTTMGDISDGKKIVTVTNNHNNIGSSTSTKSMNHNNHIKKKGILRKDAKKKKMSVTFPKEVCQVIGFGGDTSDEESDDDPVSDPLDSASVAELLDKNSFTPTEKELNRLTTKNTNFNSIKTNLLGYTSIEIGPIVGCMNGNSLSGPSKPLISIGTFETRSQPTAASKPKKFGFNITNSSNGNEDKEKLKAKKQEPVVKVNGITPTVSSSNINNNSRMTSLNSTTTSTYHNNNQKSKTSSLLSNSNNSHNQSTNASSVEKPNQSIKSSSNSSIATNANVHANVNNNMNNSNAIKTNTTSSLNQIKVNKCDVTGNAVISSIKINQENISSKLTTTSTKTITAATQKSQTLMNETLENKNNMNNSVIDNSKLESAISTTNTCSNNSNNDNDNNMNDDVYEAKPPPIPISSAPTKVPNNITALQTPNPTLSNLYILNDGNIASRRSTFLNDILSLDTPIRLDVDEGNEDSSILSLGQQDSLETPRIIKSELKPGSPIINKDFQHHFDDSLEQDSGLDIKTIKSKIETKRSLVETSSESDNEKSGSNSDSGTEHDFMNKILQRNNSNNKGLLMTVPNLISTEKSSDGLFISVEDQTSNNTSIMPNIVSKLSPDSVLSESEMSNVESLTPDEETPPLEIVPPPAPVSSGPTIPPILKRLAPPPPTQSNSQLQQQQRLNESIYTNEEELYDDVATLRDSSSSSTFTSFSNNESNEKSKQNNIDHCNDNENGIEESLYDDCATIGPPPSGKPTSSGSYDFTDTSNRSGLLDPDLNEKIPLKPDDGIEFIGIRKIDSESFLKESSPPLSSSTPGNKKDRTSSTSSSSPKPKRRVNQFFATIGKRAGAAFSRTPLDFTTPSSSSITNNKFSPTSSSAFNNSAATSFSQFSKFKRSLSQDEVSMTRTQEIYATLSPAMLKNKGLAPVLNKLSKLDLQYPTASNNTSGKEEDKISRKNKFSSSLKKFLKFGSKDSDNKYEFSQPSPTASDKSSSPKDDSRNEFANFNALGRKGSSSSNIASAEVNAISSSSPRHSSVSHLEELSTTNPGKYYVGPPLQSQQSNGTNYGVSGPCPTRPPPPPPRVYSFDQLSTNSSTHSYQQQQSSYNNPYNNHNNVNGQSGSGSVTSTNHHNNNSNKPARPPPPVIRTNKVAPSFTSVFSSGGSNENNSNNNNGHNYYNSYNNDEQSPPPLNQRRPSSNGSFNGNDAVRGSNGAHYANNPPNKPKRKASIYRAGESSDQGAYTANYLETTYNHITSLNFETLKLIASQIPATIRRGASPIQKFNKASPLRWNQFYVTDVEPLIHGKGYCFYSAFWEDESCILLVQESLSRGISPLEFDCIDSMASFEDIIPSQVITWKPSEFVNTSSGIKVFVSVLPSCTIQTLPNYLNNTSISTSRKYFAVLQAMDYWGRDELSDLIVLQQTPSESDSPISDYSCGSLASKSKYSTQSPNFGLVYVVSARLKSGSSLLSSSPSCSRGNFEASMSHLLFNNNSYHHLLSENDQNILYRRMSGSGSHEVEAQLKLFLQLKLFGAQGNDLDKILRYRSEKQVTQWMDKERAFCMKDAIERTLQRNSEPISPLRKSFVEFLMISDSCAKAVLDLIVDLNPDI